ncbi:OmpA family protein [Pedobacter gandavensis]|uniref:OmpA family protein n=1 Tax=Pedobacter gandavensis TaxID=2679963 RepID=UPI00292FC6FD|nr:OmpA family protein [Pedobacter gandavensis]
MKKISVALFLSFLIFFSARAQTSTVRKAMASFDKAQGLLNDNQYPEAIKALKEALQADPGFQNAILQLAELNRRIKSYGEAKIYYLKAIALQANSDPRMYYGLGESELFSADYTNALKHFHYFITNFTGNDTGFLARAKKYQKDCEFAIEAIKKPQAYEPINLGPQINTAYRDYFPAITADNETLIFSRNIDGNEDFFLSKKSNNEWNKAVPLSSKINTSQFNEGAQSLSPDGLYLFFTGCNRPNGLGRCDIYLSHKEGNDWGEPFNLGPPVNTAYWESQPAISPDGNTLYFVSNRPGGIGGYDIWKSGLNEAGEWSAPVNLGPEINTPYDENTPFLHADGKTLYFSSDGWPGMGNKDIFMSRMLDNGHWSNPVNMGYPINTCNEESGLIVSPNGSTAFFSADLKDGYGDMDVYQFKLPADKQPMPITYVKGIVRDKDNRQFLDAKVQVVNLLTKHAVYNDYTAKENGEFLAVMPIGANYAFNASADGYLFYSENYELGLGSRTQPFLLEINLERLKVGTNMVLKNIFFDTNEYRLLPSSLTELSTLIELLKQNLHVEIEIQGHTDNVGNDIQNEKLSLNRAKAVYDELIAQKIDPGRLKFKGYGETKPIAGNDTEEQRKQNRRTSFIVTKI